MNQRERMLSGLPYKAWLDGLRKTDRHASRKFYDFNQLPPSRQSKEAPQMIKNIFGKIRRKLSGWKHHFTVTMAGTLK